VRDVGLETKFGFVFLESTSEEGSTANLLTKFLQYVYYRFLFGTGLHQVHTSHNKVNLTIGFKRCILYMRNKEYHLALRTYCLWLIVGVKIIDRTVVLGCICKLVPREPHVSSREK
jgi:hypothetical protein